MAWILHNEVCPDNNIKHLQDYIVRQKPVVTDQSSGYCNVFYQYTTFYSKPWSFIPLNRKGQPFRRRIVYYSSSR